MSRPYFRPSAATAYDPTAVRVRVPPREAEALDLLVRGLTDKEIERAMGLRPGVAKMYLRSARQRVGLDNRVQLALWWAARREG
jgi:DNA-binding CsgD family transcriptional regulator